MYESERIERAIAHMPIYTGPVFECPVHGPVLTEHVQCKPFESPWVKRLALEGAPCKDLSNRFR